MTSRASCKLSIPNMITEPSEWPIKLTLLSSEELKFHFDPELARTEESTEISVTCVPYNSPEAEDHMGDSPASHTQAWDSRLSEEGCPPATTINSL